MTISSPPDKWYLKLFNLNETLHVPRLSISPAAYSRLMGNEFRDFEKFKKNIVRNTLKSARSGFAVVEYYFQSSKPLLCKLFEHCALAQRSGAPEPCFESQSRLKVMIVRIFMILIFWGVSNNLVSPR